MANQATQGGPEELSSTSLNRPSTGFPGCPPFAQGAVVPPKLGNGGAPDVAFTHGALVAGKPIAPGCPVHEFVGPGKVFVVCVGPAVRGTAVAARPAAGRTPVGTRAGPF